MPNSTLDPKSILPMMITSRDGNNFELIFFQIIIAEQHRKCLLEQSGANSHKNYHTSNQEEYHEKDQEDMAQSNVSHYLYLQM